MGDILYHEMNVGRDVARNAVDSIKSSSENSLGQDEAETVLSTAIVVNFLEKKLPEEEETWELVVEKAREWLGEAIDAKLLEEVWKLADSILAV